MKRVAVVYKSRYGSAKKYGQWLGAGLGADFFDLSQVGAGQLEAYDWVVFGGGLYAGTIKGLHRFLKLRSRNISIFTVGLYDPEIIDYEPIRKKNFSTRQLAEIRVFHLPGYCDYQQLSLPHKTMIFTMKKVLAKKPADELSAEERVLLASYGVETDLMDEKALEPMLDFLDKI